MRGRFGLAPALLLCSVFAGAAYADSLRFELGRVDHPALTLDSVLLSVSDEATSAELTIGRLDAAGRSWRDLRLGCPDLRIELPYLTCSGGRLTARGETGAMRVDFRVNALQGGGDLQLKLPAGDAASISWAQGGEAAVEIERLDLKRLAEWVPAAAEFGVGGYFSGRVTSRSGDGSRTVLDVDGRVHEGAFASQDGLKAAEGLALSVKAGMSGGGGAWDFNGDLRWTEGEAYVHPVYTTAGARLVVAGTFAEGILDLARASLEIDGVDAIETRLRVGVPDGKVQTFGVAVARADLAVVGPRFIAPVVAPARASSLSFAGHVSAGIEIADGVLKAADVTLDEVGFRDGGSALAFGPLSGFVPWRADAATEAQLSFQGGRWERLELGAFELKARLQGEALDIDELAVPVLDGRVVLQNLALRRSLQGWEGSGAAVIEPISMPLLTTAVGLPSMAGDLSASLPGLRVSPGELALDGSLAISVFDGHLRITDLLVIEPFGVASRLFSNITARNIDLGQLTETFSFGGITGAIDIDLAGLELAHWKPVRFDAHVRSSPGRYQKRISQRAVQNLGALAGPGAALALQRGVLGFFETFGYRQIGLRCHLDDGVCIMGGIGEETSGPYDIVRGGGIPALNVIGYNRRVDWNELIDRLQRVIESNSAPEIR